MTIVKKTVTGPRAMLGFALLLPALACAQAPVPLSPVWEPVSTRVEVQGDVQVIHLGERQFRLLPPAPDKDGKPRRVLEGPLRVVDYDGYRPRGTRAIQRLQNDYFWLLPGYGIAPANPGKHGHYSYLLRGSDGLLDPPLSGSTGNFGLQPVVIRAGAADTELLAERTLLIFGSRREFDTQGIGKQARSTPVAQVSAAWLFDRQGVIRQWSPLERLPKPYNAAVRSEQTAEYLGRGPQGEVMFATAGAGDTLDVHVLSTGLEPLRTWQGVRVLRQQTEQPINRGKTPDSAEYWSYTFVGRASIGNYAFERTDVPPVAMKAVLLAPIPGAEGWYGVLQPDGSLQVPGGGIGLKPLTRERTQPVKYTLAYGYLVAYRVQGAIRYGWASPQLTVNTGPVWRKALLVDSERLAEPSSMNVDPRLLLVQLDTGAWQAIAEPKVHVAESTFLEPNTFSGFLPPAGTPERAAELAEAVVIQLGNALADRNFARQSSTLAHMRAERQADAERRRIEQARREEVWKAVMDGLVQGVGALKVEPLKPTRKPSALGAEYYWEGGALIHAPTNTTVR